MRTRMTIIFLLIFLGFVYGCCEEFKVEGTIREIKFYPCGGVFASPASMAVTFSNPDFIMEFVPYNEIPINSPVKVFYKKTFKGYQITKIEIEKSN